MQAHHAMPSFQCRMSCKHTECQHHAPLGFMDANKQCKCLDEVNADSIFLENVIDLANTLAQIMIACGIHECKAKSTIDITIYAFLHYDQVCYCLEAKPKKRLRKEDLFHELGKKCLMNRVEAHLAYSIIKRGFKAFYYEEPEKSRNECEKPKFPQECVWIHAAKRTADNYARFNGLSCEEQRGFEAKVKVIYKKFFDRMNERKNQQVEDTCNCCFCSKARGHLVYGRKPPCETKKKTKHYCPRCCNRVVKKKFIHPGRVEPLCTVCKRARRYCICPKYEFTINWVKSIWCRPDFELYFNQKIEEGRHQSLPLCKGSVTDAMEPCRQIEEEGEEEDTNVMVEEAASDNPDDAEEAVQDGAPNEINDLEQNVETI